MNLVTQYRREYFLNHVDPAAKTGLEIGPHNQPMVTKDEGNIVYMDFLTREEHIKKDSHAPYIEDIPETDIIIKDNNYINYVDDRRFDYIIANHVAEHAPDFVGFLNMLSSMLNPDGIVFLAIPDKKFTFDKFRQNTTLAHVVSDHLRGPEVSIREHLLEILFYYDNAFIGKPQDLMKRINKDTIREKMEAVPHYGLHCHVFQSETILNSLLIPLTHTGLIDLDLLEFYEARPERGSEMIVLLVKQPATHPIVTDDFLVVSPSCKSARIERLINLEEKIFPLNSRRRAFAKRGWRLMKKIAPKLFN
jgi:SAM-dependent methyltransferase